MALPMPVKALAFVVFIAAIAGATYAVQRAVPTSDLEGQFYTTSFVRPILNATTDHDVTFAIEVKNRGPASRVIQLALEGDGVKGASAKRTVAHEETTIFFVPVNVSADEPGEKLLALRILGADGALIRVRDDVATLRVLPTAPGLAEGDTASLVYLGRLADTGAVFDTNDVAFKDRTFAQTSLYQLRTRLLPLSTTPPNVVTGFYEGVLGMQAGESRRIVVTPDKGYGNATEQAREPRAEDLAREFLLPVMDEEIGRASFARYIEETRQGNASSFGAGSMFVLREAQTDNVWPYRVVAMNDTVVTYRLSPAEGESYTLYPFWRGGSVVRSVNETTIFFYTTPTTAEGQSFQARSYWPNMTAISAMNETSVTIRHSPPVGFRFTLPQGGQPVETTVTEVTETEIVTSTANPHPLAGQTLEFDVTMVTLTKGAGSGSG